MNKIITVSIPNPGEGEIIDVQTHGIRILAERVEAPLTSKPHYAPVFVAAPASVTIHAARSIQGEHRTTVASYTLCASGNSDRLKTQGRIPGLDIGHVTCSRCWHRLQRLGAMSQ